MWTSHGRYRFTPLQRGLLLNGELETLINTMKTLWWEISSYVIPPASEAKPLWDQHKPVNALSGPRNKAPDSMAILARFLWRSGCHDGARKACLPLYSQFILYKKIDLNRVNNTGHYRSIKPSYLGHGRVRTRFKYTNTSSKWFQIVTKLTANTPLLNLLSTRMRLRYFANMEKTYCFFGVKFGTEDQSLFAGVQHDGTATHLTFRT